MSGSGRCVAVLLIALALGSAQTRRSPDHKKPPAPTVPLTYTKAVEGVEGIVKGKWKEDEFIQKVLTQKVSFPATEEVKANLRNLGASEQVIEAIVKVAPQPPPDPTPERAPSGGLLVQCAPAECEVSLNGKPAGVTELGKISIQDLPVREMIIDFGRKGYLTQQKSVQIVAGTSVPVAATLEPDPATRTEFGRRALQATLTDLGVAKDLKPLWDLAGAGAATCWDASGISSEWNINLAFGPPNLMKVEARGSSGNLTLFCRGERCEPKKKAGILGGGKPPKTPAIASLTEGLALLARYQLAALLEQIVRPSNHAFAAAFEQPSDHDQHVTVETTDVVYEVTIDSRSRLSSVVLNPRSGLGAGLNVTFGSYLPLANLQYPSHTDIKLPGKGPHGIQIRLDSIGQGSDLHEKDFPK